MKKTRDRTTLKNCMNIYLAGPVFTQAERRWNRHLAQALEREGHLVILPQDSVREFITPDGNYDPMKIFNRVIVDIDKTDVVLGVFDGADVDSGTSWEFGYAYAKGKIMLGVRTDIRRGGDTESNVNIMLSESASRVVQQSAFYEDVKKLAAHISKCISLVNE